MTTIDANPLKTGLYSIRDFVRKGQEKEYANTLFDLMTDLSPEGILEQCFATEIMKATWRLRRCRNVEFDLAETAELDPMIDERTSNTQKIVDRARAQSHSLLRRSISELCKLQTTRLRGEAGENPKTAKRQQKPAAANDAGISDALATLSAVADKQLCRQYREQGLASFTQRPALIPTETASQTQDGGQSFCKPEEPAAQTEASFCKSESGGLIPTKAPEKTENGCQIRNREQVIGSKTPRNAPCPCGSGAKHKKCCGNSSAPEVKPTLNRAA